ncbi:hypothetical protein ABZ801_01245 [Actinomadura sp. NPDC047616]|uniref:hypothetical protein n=1 Tax=Actinomadura sp. NPDC047616 TaxID=3155914 RepID=UPI0033E37F68
MTSSQLIRAVFLLAGIALLAYLAFELLRELVKRWRQAARWLDQVLTESPATAARPAHQGDEPTGAVPAPQRQQAAPAPSREGGR